MAVESSRVVVRRCFQHRLMGPMLLQNVLFKLMLASAGIEYELEPYGVVVAVLFPGSFQTDLHVTRELHQMIDALWNRSSQEMRNEYGNDFDAKDFFMLLMSFINTSCYLLFI
ncbi:unnamed protein product [Acanthocheilonema viteae]|uniref:Uncharacterized protein n=1 Tax=Acanthocheilonema viteae TaxID=6277 RepID=A0A498SDF8_ACAVI|nr:unnamed protein product [Acanthocheilonema viteae]